MVIKILSSDKNFEGIDYSERKNELEKSQLLKAENLGALGHSGDELSKVDYINYRKLVCDSNPRVINGQFHAVISAKNKSHSPQELAKIAEQCLKSMGYGNNPYLIYFHADTYNNRLHMIKLPLSTSLYFRIFRHFRCPYELKNKLRHLYWFKKRYKLVL